MRTCVAYWLFLKLLLSYAPLILNSRVVGFIMWKCVIVGPNRNRAVQPERFYFFTWQFIYLFKVANL